MGLQKRRSVCKVHEKWSRTFDRAPRAGSGKWTAEEDKELVAAVRALRPAPEHRGNADEFWPWDLSEPLMMLVD